MVWLRAATSKPTPQSKRLLQYDARRHMLPLHDHFRHVLWHTRTAQGFQHASNLSLQCDTILPVKRLWYWDLRHIDTGFYTCHTDYRLLRVGAKYNKVSGALSSDEIANLWLRDGEIQSRHLALPHDTLLWHLWWQRAQRSIWKFSKGLCLAELLVVLRWRAQYKSSKRPEGQRLRLVFLLCGQLLQRSG